MARSFRDMGIFFDKIAKATSVNEEEIASLKHRRSLIFSNF